MRPPEAEATAPEVRDASWYASKAYELGIPEITVDGLVMYIVHHTPQGSFLNAVLSNDLKEACNKADLANQRALYNIVYFLYNYAPMICWGNPELVDTWVTR
jgi:hypothetical protein